MVYIKSTRQIEKEEMYLENEARARPSGVVNKNR
jgi:hypothetical protein